MTLQATQHRTKSAEPTEAPRAAEVLPERLAATILDVLPVPLAVNRGSREVYVNAMGQNLVTLDGQPSDFSCVSCKVPPAGEVSKRHPSETAAIPVADNDSEDDWTVRILESAPTFERQRSLYDDKIVRLKAIVHEFRNTLTSAREALTLLQEESVGPLNQQQGRFLDSALDDLDGLVRTTVDLTSLWVTRAGIARMTVRPVNVRQMIEQTMLCIEPAARRRGISIQVDLRGPFPRLSGDQELLVQALRNVLTNAVRHTPDGGWIVVRAYAEENQSSTAEYGDAEQSDVVAAPTPQRDQSTVIEVEDSGPGIDLQDRKKIFDAFERGEPAEARGTALGTGGMGLGLTIARDIVATHGGAVHVENAPGGGARFVFRFPYSESGLRSWMVRATEKAIEEVRPLHAPLAVMLLRFFTDSPEADGSDHADLVTSVQQLAVANLRPSDTVLAVEDQLLLLMHGCSKSAAFALIDRMLESLANMSSSGCSVFERCGMAFGVAAMPQDGQGADELLARAEADLDAFPTVRNSRNEVPS